MSAASREPGDQRSPAGPSVPGTDIAFGASAGRPSARYVKAKGMLFGLWQETGAIAKKSRLSKERPERTLRTDDGRDCADTPDLSNPDAARYAEDSVLRIIRDFKLDFCTIDDNVQVGEGGQGLRDGVRVLLDRPLTSELLLFDAAPSGRK